MEHAVIVHLRLSQGAFGGVDERRALEALGDALETEVEQTGVGEFDGHDVGQGEYVFYLYGPNADALFEAISSLLKASPLAAGGFVIKRYGEASDPDAREVRVAL